MSYYFSKDLKGISFTEAIEKTTASLKDQGFGVLTEIDMSATLKKKLDKDIKPYKILGACHPPSAYQAVTVEDHIGLMLPCNVIVTDEGDHIEVSAIDPVASMQAVNNNNLESVALDVQNRLRTVINNL